MRFTYFQCNLKILELLYLLQCHSIHLQYALIRVSWKMKYLSFGRAYFHSGGVTCICKAIYSALEARVCRRKQNLIISKQQTTDFAISDCGTLINLAAFDDPIHVNNEKERWQSASLAEFNAHIERLSLLAIYLNTNLRSAVEWLNGA